MKAFLYALAVGVPLLLTGCGKKKTDPVPTPQPEPEVGIYDIEITNPTINGMLPVGLDTRVTLAETSIRQNPGQGLLFDKTLDLLSPRRTHIASLVKRHVYFAVMFPNVPHRYIPYPSNGQYVQVDLLENGVIKRSIRLDETTVNDPANYWRVDAQTTHLMKEIDFDL